MLSTENWTGERRLSSKEESGMSLYFEELDYRLTPIGALSLRRRRELSLGVDVFEIKLGVAGISEGNLPVCLSVSHSALD
jgi:hypothetical protein